MLAQCPQSPEASGIKLTDNCGYWELNLGPLQECAVLLTIQPSLQPPCALVFELVV